MINSITFRESWAKRVGNDSSVTLTFVPGVNVLAGPNGCGKSSVISAVTQLSRGVEIPDISFDIDACSLLSRDFERDNPRTKSYLEGDPAFQLGSMFHSHGETVKAILESIGAVKEGAVLLLDEPDIALDFDGIRTLIRELKKGRFCQAVVAAHHPLVVLEKSFNLVEMRPGFAESMVKNLKSLLRTGRKMKKE